LGAFHGSQSLSLRGKGEGKWGAGGDVDELAALGELVDLGTPEEALVVGPEREGGGGARGPEVGRVGRSQERMWEDQVLLKTRGVRPGPTQEGSWGTEKSAPKTTLISK